MDQRATEFLNSFRQLETTLTNIQTMSMGKTSGVLSGLTLIGGFSLGWLLKPKEASELQLTTRSQSHVVISRDSQGSSSAPKTIENSGLGPSLSDSTKAKNKNYEVEIEKRMGGIWEPWDILGETELESLLHDWALTDLNSAIAWAKKCPNRFQQDFAYRGIINGVRMKDHNQAMEIWGRWQYERDWSQEIHGEAIRFLFLNDLLQQVSFHGEEIGIQKVVQVLENYPDDFQRVNAAAGVQKMLLKQYRSNLSPKVSEAMRELAELTRE